MVAEECNFQARVYKVQTFGTTQLSKKFINYDHQLLCSIVLTEVTFIMYLKFRLLAAVFLLMALMTDALAIVVVKR